MAAQPLPSAEGEFTAAEAQAAMDLHLGTNYALNRDISEAARTTVQTIVPEWTERVRPLHKRWRATWWMLSGNTLEKNSVEDVHIPEIYKHIETIVPRLEEVILEREPWFRIVPRRRADVAKADAMAAFIDWQFSQANLRELIQPAIRNMLVTQSAAFHVYWTNREEWVTQREIKREWTKDGRLKKSVKKKRVKQVVFSGPKADLIDPLDFIIDTKSTNPQNAQYVGHRAWLSVDEIRRLGKEFGWANLDALEDETPGSYALEQDFYKWARDPAAQYGEALNRIAPKDNRPKKLEVIFLYCKWSPDPDTVEFEDYRFVSIAGKVMLEVRKNPNDGGIRPYATMRVTKSGHEFFSVGPFDNAIRMNQHLDRHHQIAMRTAAIAGQPFVFAEEDSDLPDSLYNVRAGHIFKGVGPVRFSQVPGDIIRAHPLISQDWKNNISEVVGSYPIQMGQDSSGTATEASLSLQEGNRRQRGHLRAVADGLDQILQLFVKYNLQYSESDVEFPVLGKRALDLRKTHANMSPADLLDDVQFELVGLKSSRTYGLKATGLQAFVNSMQPFIVANPNSVDQLQLMHEVCAELVGPDEADRIVRVPTPLYRLKSQLEENEGLVEGGEIEVDESDDHEQHLKDIHPLFLRATDPNSDMHFDVRRVVLAHRETHRMMLEQQKAAEKAKAERQPQMVAPAEAGGSVDADTGNGAPMTGSVSNAMQDLANSPSEGQTDGQNPGPADSRKYGKSGRKSRTTNQTEDRVK